MSRFANSALRLLRRLLGNPTQDQAAHAGEKTVLDGNTAVALLEAEISEAAGLGASHPADTAVLAWRMEQHRQRGNPEQTARSSLVAEGPRGALAAAMGLAMAGSRATAFFSSTDLAATQDLLTAAAGQHLPLVLHAGNRGLASPAPTLGCGHEAMHLAAESGSFVLVAANVQEAVDFAVIARQVAEQALIPGLVMQDGEQTALALQDVRMPGTAFLKQFLGVAGEQISSPTEAQRLLFGDQRRRVPRQFNMDRPVMLGALQPAGTWGLAQAATAAFFDSYLAECLHQCFQLYARHTGRSYQSLSTHRVKGARLILLAQGAAVETAEAVADHLREMRVGVIGVRCLRPFPAAELVGLLENQVTLCVLERVDTPLATDAPMLREVRAAVEFALEQGKSSAASQPASPSLRANQQPRLLSAIYGLGGFPLRSADLIALCRQADTLQRTKVYLGITFAGTFSEYPKRQVLLDRLRRSYPEITDLGLCAEDSSPRLQPEDTLAVALYRRSGGLGGSLASELAVLLQKLLQGGLRCTPGQATEAWGGCMVDRITAAAEAARYPGDEIPVDLALIIAGSEFNGSCPDLQVAAGGTLLFVSPLAQTELWSRLPHVIRNLVNKGGAEMYQVQPVAAGESSANAFLAGAVCAVLLETGHLDVTHHRLLRIQEDLLCADEQHAELLESFQRGLESSRKIDFSQTTGTGEDLAPTATEDEAPAAVRRLGNIDDGYDSLPRFWDQVGVLFRNGDTNELTADPYLALGAVPPLTAGFRDLSPLQQNLPLFDPVKCSGCGACWSNCPDGAIGAMILRPGQIIETAVRQTSATAVQPLVSKLAAGIAASCRGTEAADFSAGSLLGDSFQALADKLPFPEERKITISAAMDRMIERLGSLPLAVTEPFFTEPEMEQQGSGQLLTLSIDPGLCKGCGICVQSCPVAALEAVPRSVAIVGAVRQIRNTWELLPATAAETVSRASTHPGVEPMAASMLSRNGVPGLGGGDGGEPGSGARLALRMSLGAINAHQEVIFAAYLEQVHQVRQQINGLIRDLLADALPADDLDALARGLENTDSRQADLSVFLGEAEGAISSAVDAARLQRLVEMARGLTDLGWRLEKGRQGFGRSRVSLVLSAGNLADWTGGFPHNPFAGPVVVDSTGDGAQLAAGLLEAQLRQTTEDAVLLRRARLEIERPAEAVRLWPELESLQWRDLSALERSRCPLVLLVGDGSVLGERGLAQLTGILGSELPLKALLFADLELGLGNQPEIDAPLAAIPDRGSELALLALSRRGASVAQTSIAAAGHFRQSLEQAVSCPGPALLHVHAPSPTRHGFNPELTIERAAAAIDARVFPLFRYDPQGEGVFGSRISLEGNPAPREAWLQTTDDAAITPADWASGETRFTGCFTPLTEQDSAPLPLDQYLRGAPSERAGMTPALQMPGASGAIQGYRVAHSLVLACEARLHGWRVLQELAGLVTPFTAQVQQEAEQRVANVHKAELEAQANTYEQRIAGLRDELLEQTRQEVHLRLMRLAGYRSAAAKQEVNNDASHGPG
jgi:pyruvate-ferredoxin/flavodoxin oxidoreductase